MPNISYTGIWANLKRGPEAQTHQVAFQCHLVAILNVHLAGLGSVGGEVGKQLFVNGSQYMVTVGSGATWEEYRAPGPKGTGGCKNREEDPSVSWSISIA